MGTVTDLRVGVVMAFLENWRLNATARVAFQLSKEQDFPMCLGR